jgi:hypothetical protein
MSAKSFCCAIFQLAGTSAKSFCCANFQLAGAAVKVSIAGSSPSIAMIMEQIAVSKLVGRRLIPLFFDCRFVVVSCQNLPLPVIVNRSRHPQTHPSKHQIN